MHMHILLLLHSQAGAQSHGTITEHHQLTRAEQLAAVQHLTDALLKDGAEVGWG